uniref:Uncharacterized protein n=1 Tax=Strombidinopsis acuminata TaxID=141414 RepID=A0A7S3U481_9SPIT
MAARAATALSVFLLPLLAASVAASRGLRVVPAALEPAEQACEASEGATQEERCRAAVKLFNGHSPDDDYWPDDCCDVIERKLAEIARQEQRCTRESTTCWGVWQELLPLYKKHYEEAAKEKGC